MADSSIPLHRGHRKLTFQDVLPSLPREVATFVETEEVVLSAGDRQRLQAAINKRDRKARKNQLQLRKRNIS